MSPNLVHMMTLKHLCIGLLAPNIEMLKGRSRSLSLNVSAYSITALY